MRTQVSLRPLKHSPVKIPLDIAPFVMYHGLGGILAMDQDPSKPPNYVKALGLLERVITTAIFQLERHNSFEALRILKEGLLKEQEMCPVENVNRS